LRKYTTTELSRCSHYLLLALKIKKKLSAVLLENIYVTYKFQIFFLPTPKTTKRLSVTLCRNLDVAYYFRHLSAHSMSLSTDSSDPSGDSSELSEYFLDSSGTLRRLYRLWEPFKDFRYLTTVFRASQRP
jgi:hypothetical protein